MKNKTQYKLPLICSAFVLTLMLPSCNKGENTPKHNLDHIAVADNSKKNYKLNEEFVTPIVTAYYTDQRQQDVSTLCVYTGFSSENVGEKEVTVTYEEKQITKSTSYTVIISEAIITLEKIEVTSYKKNYTLNEEFSQPTVIATFSDGSTSDCSSSCVYTGFTTTSIGEKEIQVSYTKDNITKTTSYKINVKDNPSLLRYAIFADVQLCNDTLINGGTDANANFGETANAPLALKSHLEFCKKENINTILMNGDITNQANEYYYQNFEKITKSVYGDDKNIWPEFLWNMGNHEWWWGTSEKETGDAVSMFRKYARISSDNLVDESDTAYKLNNQVNVPSYYKVINGIPFITISAESSAGDIGSKLKNEIITWLNEAKKLDTAKNGGPIFVQYHYPLHTSMTHGQAAADTCTTVEDIFKDTPNAVIFTGDTHFPGVSERSINQVNFTTINLGTSSYSRMVCTGATKMNNFYNVEQSGQKIADKMLGNAKFNNAYTPTIQIVNVNTDNTFSIDRYFSTGNGNGSKVGQTWQFNPIKSKDDFTFTNARFNNTQASKALYGKTGLNWNNEDKVIFGINGTQATVRFPDVIDYHYCEHYLIDINGKKYDEVSNYYKNLEERGENYFILEDVPSSQNYNVTVTAYDFYDNPSTNTLTSSNNDSANCVDAIDYQSTLTYCDIQTRNRFDEVSDEKDSLDKDSQSSIEIYYKGIQVYQYGAIANRLFYRDSKTISCKNFISLSDNKEITPTVRVDVKNLENKDIILGLSIIKWEDNKEVWKSDFGTETQKTVSGNNWKTLYWDLSQFDITSKEEIAGVAIKAKSKGADSNGYVMNFLMDNIDIIDEKPGPKYRGVEYTAGSDLTKTIPDTDPNTGTYVFDLLFLTEATTYIQFMVFNSADWDNYLGNFRILANGTPQDTYNGISIDKLPDNYYRITMDFSKITNITGKRPTNKINSLYMRGIYTTASGYIDLNPTI